ncbi:MAG: prepilin-type N-terminal cleavage/methylation domain-containing protein, partial [Verrucomicrobiota bacterium]|nr:prepilin-type N-terminal cleavage/methylation domain-containing protein [Verrucomicrobiota bacterium]
TCPSPSAGPSRAGFTLLELVVVLAILAAVTMLATREVAKQQHQLRYEQSRRLMDELEVAITGDRYARPVVDARRPPPAFVEDMGRLPRAVTNQMDPAELTLGELFRMPEAAVPFGLFSATNRVAGAVSSNQMDEGVWVPMGWRGPYMRLPAGDSDPFLRDGWGNPFTSKNADVGELQWSAGDLPNRLLGENWKEVYREENPPDAEERITLQRATNGMPIAFIRHLGANGLSPVTEGEESGYDMDVTIAPLSNAFATIRGTVEFPMNAVDVRVRLYGPPPDAATAEEAGRVMIWEATNLVPVDGSAAFAFTNADITIGHRILRASASVVGTDRFSAPRSVYLFPGVNANISLSLPD